MQLLTGLGGGPNDPEGRAVLDDADWVALGAVADDAAYYARFEQLFGLDIRPTG